ncbi:MAG: M28 family peptidase [Bacteroidales bacterium]|nr:M28 family peptidase [Bacteroidales bacterium]
MKGIVCGLLLCFFIVKSQEQLCSKEDVTLYIQKVIDTLASHSFLGRLAGTKGDSLTREFIKKELKKLKKVHLRECFFTYHRDSQLVKTANVQAWLGDTSAGKFVVLMAHYDHIGYGEIKSRSFFKHEIHPGADDNASGVALLLALAGWLTSYLEMKQTSYAFLVVFISGHEDGLFGSKELLADLEKRKKYPNLVINFDMVGRLKDEIIVKNRTVWKDSLIDKLKPREVRIRFSNNEMFLTDAYVFENIAIPVLHITTGWHDDYHRTTDTPEKINFPGIQLVYDFVITLLTRLHEFEAH